MGRRLLSTSLMSPIVVGSGHDAGLLDPLGPVGLAARHRDSAARLLIRVMRFPPAHLALGLAGVAEEAGRQRRRLRE